MAESSLCTLMGKNELASLKETLFNQQQLIQDLYFELEKEREASATAASEALSMILRLQGERAAEKMEAHQYKRMAEEKIHHVEDSLGELEELVYQKEMEIASLEFQVQAYKHKLLSLGFAGLEIRESESPKTISFYNNDAEFDKMKCCGVTKREPCMSIVLSKEPCLKKSCVERGAFSLRQKINGQNDCECVESTSENCNSHWERIEKIDEQVKELIHTESHDEEIEPECFRGLKELQSVVAAHPASLLRSRLQSYSWHSASSHAPGYSEGGAWTHLNSDVEGPEITETVDNKCNLVKIQDVFEIPQKQVAQDPNSEIPQKQLAQDPNSEIPQKQVARDPNSEIPQKQVAQDPNSEGENRFQKPDSIHDYLESLLIKKTLVSAQQESIKQALIFAKQNNKLSAQQFADLKTDVNLYKAKFEQINKRLQLLEDERHSMRQEAEDRRKMEMELLGEIRQQIKEIHSYLKIPKAEKRSRKDDSKMASFMEAMLSFSI